MGKDVFEKFRMGLLSTERPSKVPPIEAILGSQVVCGGRRKVQFSSNNYLGLAQDTRVLEAAQAAIRKYGVGSTGSKLRNGQTDLHLELEERLANFLSKEAVVLLSTGWLANQGALTSLLTEGEAVLCDEACQPSLMDAAASSQARLVKFAHNNAPDLDRHLQQLPEGSGAVVCMEGLFRSSGQSANVKELLKIAKAHCARTLLDESHSLGVYGTNGAGLGNAEEVSAEIDLVSGTFSNAFGAMGGFLAGPRHVLEAFTHSARCLAYTASLTPAMAGAVLKGMDILEREPELRALLWSNVEHFQRGLESLGLNEAARGSAGPVFPILVRDRESAYALVEAFFEAGIYVSALTAPAGVSAGGYIRMSLSATHSKEELDYALDVLSRIAPKLGILNELAYTASHVHSNNRMPN